MTAIRGLILGACVILLVWFIGEIILRSVDIRLRKERAEGMARQAVVLPAKKQELRMRLEEGWAVEASIAGSDQASTRAGSEASIAGYTNSVYGVRYPDHPQQQFIPPL
ncbi:hypothetical protein FOZ63_021679, partial [Perkinsus olseni]